MEIPDAIYLVKIKVKVDDYEDVQNGLFKDDNDDDDDDSGDDGFPASDEDFADDQGSDEGEE